jgi:catechol-2,3-dioxygenase
MKVIALSVTDLERASKFYGKVLALPPAYEGNEQVGYPLGQTILMLKAKLVCARSRPIHTTDHAALYWEDPTR